MSRKLKNKRGQAVAEMALFGSLIIMIFATILSYVQRSNDQQYVQMEAFRRALQKACTYQGTESEGAGASTQYTVIDNRRHADLSGNYRKGSTQTVSASNSVFWAVPKIGAQPENLLFYKINEDEQEIRYRDYVSEDDEDDLELRIEDMVSSSDTSFNESITKEESTAGITNTRVSELKDTVTTTLPFSIREKDDDSDPDNDVIVEDPQGRTVLWQPVQGLYLDTDGQYKYSTTTVGNTVKRGKEWETQF